MGTKVEETAEPIPKPMIKIGYRPILWYVMRYYAHFGHKEFILALGYKADMIKDYFIHYDERTSNNFVLSNGGDDTNLLSSDISDWRITFVDTGVSANMGERLLKLKDYLKEDEVFLANYADRVTDLPLDQTINNFMRHPDKIASVTSYKPNSSFHTVEENEKGEITRFTPIEDTGIWLISGYYIFRREVFDYLNEGDELHNDLLPNLIQHQKLITYRHQGFLRPIDTFKDKMKLRELYESENPPWELWRAEQMA